MAIDLAELRAWREGQGLSQTDVALLLGMGGQKPGEQYGTMERGKRPISKRNEAKIRKMLEGFPGTAAIGSEPETGDTDPLISETRVDDLPPLGIEPGEEGETTAAGVKRLSEYESLELELLRLLVGHRYQYEDFVNGRPVMLTGKIPGLADLCDGLGWPGDATLLRQLAPQLAHGYVEWGRHNKRVLAILRGLTAGGAAKEALIPTGQLIFGLLMLHGLMPSPREMLASMRAQEDGNGEQPAP